jgi:acyl carrier protein
MADHIRIMLLAALSAGRFGHAPAVHVREAVVAGDRELRTDQLGFDSLAWMEFCISVELQSGQELTPEDVENMSYVYEIEEWLRARL